MSLILYNRLWHCYCCSFTLFLSILSCALYFNPSDYKFPQFFSTLLSILVNLNSSVISAVSILSQHTSSPNLYSRHFWRAITSRAQVIIGTTAPQMFCLTFCLGLSIYPVFAFVFSSYHMLVCWNCKVHCYSIVVFFHFY